MPRQYRRLQVLVVFIMVMMLAVAYYRHKNSDALWRIISEQCIPGQQHGNPSPCQRVDFAQGYVTLKDLNGPLQYLLMPVEKITGIESPRILDPKTANFFAAAWHERTLLAKKRGAAVADNVILTRHLRTAFVS